MSLVRRFGKVNNSKQQKMTFENSAAKNEFFTAHKNVFLLCTKMFFLIHATSEPAKRGIRRFETCVTTTRKSEKCKTPFDTFDGMIIHPISQI